VKRTDIEEQLPKGSREASIDPQEEIRRRAYQIYEERGGLNGSALQDWLQAEAEVLESPRIRKAA
jgi:Protein of unknown function (DUF2934)